MSETMSGPTTWMQDPDTPLGHQRFRMPVVFGPTPGPRNVPTDKTPFQKRASWTILSATAATDGDLLERLLPPRLTLREPTYTVTYQKGTDLGWLAGRGYNIVAVSVPVTFEGRDEVLEGDFCTVCWENLPDAVLTGREELGWPKLWCDVDDLIPRGPGAYSGAASWLGFRFFELEVRNLAPPPADAPASNRGPQLNHFNYDYMPTSDSTRREDAAYANLQRTVPSSRFDVQQVLVGDAEFRFVEARWEDMPTQYHVVARLAELPIHEFRRATLIVAGHEDTGVADGTNLDHETT
jgi:hypothetical protein